MRNGRLGSPALRYLVGVAVVVLIAPGVPAIAAERVDPVLAAAGDIACDPANSSFRWGSGTDTECRMKAVSNLLVAMSPTVVAALGDNQYADGGYGKWAASFGPTWGRLKGRIRPAAGNHEYYTPRAEPYFRYFGAVAGDPRRGYYSYQLGTWHIVVLNSNCDEVGGCGWESPQLRWLWSDLANQRAKCTLAYWHHPRWSSGRHGSDPAYGPFWEVLHRWGAEIVLSGHDHHYERFGPQTPQGRFDYERGVRQFVVGSGGASHYGLRRIEANSWARSTSAFGVLRLTLRPSGYDWRFVPEPGRTFTDSGSTPCH